MLKNLNPVNNIKTSSVILFAVVLITSFSLAAFSYRILSIENGQTRAGANSTASPRPNTPVTRDRRTGTANYQPCGPHPCTLGSVADTQHPVTRTHLDRLRYRL